MGRIADGLVRWAEAFDKKAAAMKRNDPDFAAQTRFSKDEYELLLQVSKDAGMDEHAFLTMCVERQMPKLQNAVVASDEESYAEQVAARAEQSSESRALILQELKTAVVVDSRGLVSPEDLVVARDYGLRAGCRTAFAARRHAFIAEMQDQGIIDGSLEIPSTFAGSVI